MTKNQTAWNSDNQGIKGTIDQTNQTGKTGGWREPEARQQTERNHGEVADHAGGAGCSEVAGCVAGADLRGN